MTHMWKILAFKELWMSLERQPLNPEISENWVFHPAETTDTFMMKNEIKENNRRPPPLTSSSMPEKFVSRRLPWNRIADKQTRHGAENVGNHLGIPSFPPVPFIPQTSHHLLEEHLYNILPPVSRSKLLFLNHDESFFSHVERKH